MRFGAETCRDWINSKGGITVNGEQYKINLIIEDGKSDVAGHLSAATKLVHQDKVRFIIGAGVSEFINAIQSVTEKNKVLYALGLDMGMPGVVGPKNPYTFGPVPGGAYLTEGLYDHLTKAYPNVKRVALLSAEDAAGFHFTKVSKQIAESKGLTVTAIERFPFDIVDFYPLLTKILATKPDAIDGTAQAPPWAASLLKQAHELGFTGPQFSTSQIDLNIIKGSVDKKFANDYFNPSVNMGDPNLPPVLLEVLKFQSTRSKAPFTSDHIVGFDALWTMLQAIEKAQSLDTTVVKQTWEKMDKIESLFGTGKMGGQKKCGINHVLCRPASLSALDNGKIVSLPWYYLDVP
jgi:branched-chain amino acid transport system substrate-binding protein